MPTGYTADLEAKKYNVKEWLKTSVIRAMGVCVTLRDHEKMSTEEIEKALEKEASNSYHAQKLKDAQKSLDEFKSMTPSQLQEAYEKERSGAKESFEKRLTEQESKKKAHQQAMAEVEELWIKVKDTVQNEVTVGTLKFAREQLKQAFSFDYGHEPYKEEVLNQSLDAWNVAKRKKLLWDIEYHGKELVAEEKRNYDRYRQFKAFVEFVDKA